MTHRPMTARRRKKLWADLASYAVLLLIALVCAGPFLWTFLTSFKSGQNIYDLSIHLKNLTLSNFVGLFQFLNIPKAIGNTLIVTAGSIVLDVVFSALCAYPLACMRFRGRNLVNTVLISAMIIPAAAGTIINYLTITKLGMYNTLTGVILPGSVKVFSVILLRQAFTKVPRELIEAAEIDGASERRILWKIMVPQIMPSVSTVVIFDFIGKWNEFLWPVIVLKDTDKYPLATTLQYLNGSLNYKFGYVAAGTVVSIIPVILVFVLCQRSYIEAVSGAVKG